MLQVPLDGNDIFLRFANQHRPLVFASWLTPNKVKFTHAGVHVDNGPSITTFTAPEMSLFSADGIPAEKWTDFPVGTSP